MYSKMHPNPYGESKTKHVPDALTDINKIVARIVRTGQMPPPRAKAIHADISGVTGDLHQSLDLVKKAKATARSFIKPKPVQQNTPIPSQPAVGLVPPTPPENAPPNQPSKPA